MLFAKLYDICIVDKTKIIQLKQSEMRNSVKRQKKSNIPKILFDATTEDEKKYLEKLEDLLKKKRNGDWEDVAKLLGVSTQSAQKAFLRVYSKNHFEAVAALEKVIENRSQLLK